MTLSSMNVEALRALRNGPFAPLGWLWSSVFAELRSLGLVVERADGFRLTEYGRRTLEELDGEGARDSPMRGRLAP